MVAAAAALESFVAAVDRERLGVYGVQVRVGDERAAHRWRSDDRENLYSLSKGVCALAAGIAIDEGLLTLDTTVGETLPGLPLGDGVEAVTLHRLLTMTSGIDFPWFGHQPVPGPDLAVAMLSRPSRGRVFQYSDASTYVAMRMLGSIVGDVRDWLLPRLFDPLGIENPQWHRCPLGWIVGGTGLELRTEEVARIADVLLDRGRWRCDVLVSAAWIDAMHGSWIDTGREPPMDRYGIATWAGPRDTWRLEGRYGQFPGVASGTLNSARQVGSVFGVAVLGALGAGSTGLRLSALVGIGLVAATGALALVVGRAGRSRAEQRT